MKSSVRAFGFRDKIGYLFGDFGNDFTFIFSTTVLMKFYTDVIGVSAATVGIVMMAARFVDAFTDVAMGRICDHSKITRQGKFRPWILRMCIPVALASFLIYQPALAAASSLTKTFWLAVTYILWGSVFYTAINIPYGSMASAVSAEPHHRQSLSTFRTMGGTLAGMIIGVGVPLFAFVKIDGKDVLSGARVSTLAAIFSFLSVVCYLLCFALVKERVHAKKDRPKPPTSSPLQLFKTAFRSRALLSVIAASIVMLLAQLTMQNMAGYLYPDYYNTAAAQSVSTLFMVGAMAISAGLAGPLGKKYGKAEISAVSSLFAALICFILYFLKPANVWIFVILQSLCWLGLGIFAMVNWALITDVTDDAELKNGVREDGSIYALYSFARKLGQAAAAGASGFLLTLIGYDSSAAAITNGQSPSVLQGIFAISTLLPAVGFLLLGLILWFWYPLHKKRVEQNVAALKKKHDLP